MKKLSLNDINKKIQDKFGNEYEILSEYVNIDEPITIEHLKCGNVWKQTFYNFIKGTGCKICNKKPQYNLLSKENFEKRVKDKFGEQYTILKYDSLHSKIVYHHNYFFNSKGNKIVCDHDDIANDGADFLKRRGKRSFCRYCRGHKINLDIDYELNNNDNNKYCIYKHINKTNKKIYIGITEQTFKERWNNGFGYIGQDYFYSAIKKYSWNNFIHYAYIQKKWILVNEEDNLKNKYDLTKSECLDLEQKFIKKYRNKYGKVNVYNISDGGEGITGVREKKVLQFSFNGEFIKSFDSIKQASEITGCSYGGISSCCNHNIHHSGGYIWRFETDNSSLIIPEKIIKKNIKVYQYDLKGNYIKMFNSIKEAATFNHASSSLILQCCNGNLNSAKGYIFRYYKVDKLIDINELIFWKKRKVYQYTLKGDFIKSYSCMAEAEKETGCPAIWNCCQKRQYQSGGYIWTHDEGDVEWYIKKIQGKRNINQKNVYKYNLKKELLNTYKSVKKCAEDNKISKQTVGRYINGKRKVYDNQFIFLTDENNTLKELERRIEKYNKSL